MPEPVQALLLISFLVPVRVLGLVPSLVPVLVLVVLVGLVVLVALARSLQQCGAGLPKRDGGKFV